MSGIARYLEPVYLQRLESQRQSARDYQGTPPLSSAASKSADHSTPEVLLVSSAPSHSTSIVVIRSRNHATTRDKLSKLPSPVIVLNPVAKAQHVNRPGEEEA